MRLVEKAMIIVLLLISTWIVMRFTLVGIFVVGINHTTENVVTIVEANEVIIVQLEFV